MAMNKAFIISDTHFGHKNMVRKWRFGGSNDQTDIDVDGVMVPQDIFDHDVKQIAAINQVVRPDDDLIWVGDVALGGAKTFKRVMPKVNGFHRLVMGNHDNYNGVPYGDYFKRIYGMWEVTRDGVEILFTHAPVHPIVFMNHKNDGLRYHINVHGHLHERFAIKADHQDWIAQSFADSRYMHVNRHGAAYYNANVDMNGKTPLDLDVLIAEYKRATNVL